VIIPTYNRAPILLRAVESAIAACSDDDEIIVVDDGSKDNTESALVPVRERIRYVKIANSGAGRARNVGLEHASRPLVAFLDSDDAWLPFKLTLQRAVMAEHPELVFCCTNFAVRTADREHPAYLQNWWTSGTTVESAFGPGVPFASPSCLPDPGPVSLHITDLYRTLMIDGVVCLITLLYRRAKTASVRFPEDLPTYEDWEFTARLAKCGPAGYLDCDTAVNYGHPGPRLTDANALICAQTRLKVMPRIWGSDQEFLAKHSAEYEEIQSQQNLRAARWLIRHARNREARSYLANVRTLSPLLRVAAALPMPKAAADLLRRAIERVRGE
jgi:glycosyltransferase involved in cell wall biosynthesis